MTQVPSLEPDQFFDAEQQRRLGELMAAWRQARDTGAGFPFTKQLELNRLIEAELCASANRSAMWADEAGL